MIGESTIFYPDFTNSRTSEKKSNKHRSSVIRLEARCRDRLKNGLIDEMTTKSARINSSTISLPNLAGKKIPWHSRQPLRLRIDNRASTGKLDNVILSLSGVSPLVVSVATTINQIHHLSLSAQMQDSVITLDKSKSIM